MKLLSRWSCAFIMMSGMAPAVSPAGEIRGAVTVAGKSVGEGVPIEVRCGDHVYSATTDKYGFYRLFIPENGTCRFELHYRDQTPSREIISFEDSTRYDMAVDKEGNTYVLRRK